MNQLIRVSHDGDRQAVSARELYDGLVIRERFSIWWERCIKTFGLIEGESYCRQTYTNANNQEFEDYSVPIDIGKHICMISGSEKAHTIRNYFIGLEKAWNSPEQVMARALQIADRRINNLQAVIEEQKPMRKLQDMEYQIASLSDKVDLVVELLQSRTKSQPTSSCLPKMKLVSTWALATPSLTSLGGPER